MNIPYFQRKAGAFAENKLTEYLHTPVKIGKIEISWLNRIVLKDVEILDKENITILEANNLTAGFELLPALNNKWVITTVRLFGFSLNLTKKTPESKTNLEEIIEPLMTDGNGNSDLNLRVSSILLRRGNFTYHVLNKPQTKDVFNPNHINVNDISGKLSLQHFSKDSIHAEISKLSFAETSGFTVKKWTARFYSDKDSISVKDFALHLPHSTISVPQASVGAGLLKTDSVAGQIGDASFMLQMDSSLITPADFAAFLPWLQHFKDKATVAANLSGNIHSLNVNAVTVRYGHGMAFAGDLNLKGLGDKDEDLYVDGKVKELKIVAEELLNSVNGLNGENIKIPQPLMNIEELQFVGDVCGYLGNMQTHGTLSSPVGSIQADMTAGYDLKTDKTFALKGSVSSSDLQINKLFEDGNPYGTACFEVEIDLTKLHGQAFSGNVTARINEAQYKGYNYENIYLSGKFSDNEYEVTANVNDLNGKLSVNGFFKNDRENPLFDFYAELTDFRPDKLNLSNKFKNPVISLNISALFKGNSPDNFDGYINMDDFAFYTEEDSLDINRLCIEANPQDSLSKQLSVSSDVVSGKITGNYSFSTLLPDLLATAEKYAPTLIRPEKNKKPYPHGKEKNNDFDFFFTINNTDNLTKILNIPVSIADKGNIKGHYSSQSNMLETEISIKTLSMGKTLMEDTRFLLKTEDDSLNMRLRSSVQGKNHTLNSIDLFSSAKNDSLQSTFAWTNDGKEKYSARLNISTLFTEDSIRIALQPAQIAIKDSLWNIESSAITFAGGNIHVDNFRMAKKDQFLHIDGDISRNPQQKLTLDLKDIEMGYIFDVVNIPILRFGGKTTGTVNARELFDSRMIEGKIEVQDFSFNDATLGKLHLSSEWDETRQGILLLGSIYSTDSTWTDVNGYIFPVGDNQGLSLYFDANDLNLGFLYKYFEAFSNKMSGRGFGNLHLHGSFSDVFLEGTAFVKDVNLGVSILNTDYTFSTDIRLDKTSITTENTVIKDKDGNTGLLTLNFRHTNFTDLKYDLNLAINKMLIYDATPRMQPEIYGKVYVSGTGQIEGTEDYININANMRTEAGTSVGFNFMEHSTAKDYDFITFVNKNRSGDSLLIVPENGKKKMDAEMDYNFDFMLNATPEAAIELVLDPVSGDKLQGSGNGAMHVLYGKRNDLQMFGNFNITSGIYNFKLQQLYRKRFNISEGSTVAFNGDPLNARLGIVASYRLSANIQDLDEALLFETANTNVPVNCILKLDGALQNPAISFDLQLPNSSSELERQVRSFIDTKDMMARQIIYLLVLNKFFTPDYSSNNFRTNEFSAVASSAISAQLSSILSNISDKVQIGTNIRSRQDGIKDTEIEMILSSRLLNNRLIFNGNFGYKDNAIQQNSYIGEFDLEYKLNRSGEISLKAYNHANDLYHYNTKSLTRQGVGVMFKKDFSILREIFRRRKKDVPLKEDKKNIISD